MSHPCPIRRRKTGFTLIELLVVIGIIAILVGISVPVISKGMGMAQRTRCSNNLKELSLGFMLATEHSARNTSNLLPPLNPSNQWSDELVTNTVDRGVLTCPSVNVQVTNGVLSYSGHSTILLQSKAAADPSRMSDIRRPSEVILIGDSVQNSSGVAGFTFSQAVYLNAARSPSSAAATKENLLPVSGNAEPGTQGYVRYRHRYSDRAAAMMVCVDGHAEAIPLDTLKVKHFATQF